MSNIPVLPDSYPELLELLKREIGSARTRATLAVNRELIGLYWRIGREILVRQEREGWGSKVVPTLSRDLRNEFPEMSGLAERNLRYMRDFARSWPDEAMLPQAVAKLPWGHIRCLLESEFCFAPIRGEHWTASARAYHWKAVKVAAGWGGSLYLATRHFAGWYMVNVLDVPPEDVAIALGHTDGGELVRASTATATMSAPWIA